MVERRGTALLASLALLVIAQVCSAQQLVIGSGAALSLGSTTLDAGCRDVQVAGILEIDAGTLRNVRDIGAAGSVRGGTGTLSLSGDLALAPALQAGQGTVRVADGCGRSQSRIHGEHQFHRLLVQGDDGHALVLPAGATQTIADALELKGGLQRLVLRSTSPGSVGLLALASGGTQQITRVDAQDVGAPASAQHLAPDLPAVFDSLDRGNTPRFFFGGPEDALLPVPAMSPSGLLLLILLIAAMASWRFPSRSDP